MNEENHPDPDTLWFHRRWQAWAGFIFSLISMLTGAFLANHNQEAYEAARALFTAGVWAGLAPVAFYFGNSAVEGLAKIKRRV